MNAIALPDLPVRRGILLLRQYKCANKGVCAHRFAQSAWQAVFKHLFQALMTHTLRSMLLLAAAISFGLGIALPLVEFKKLYFFSETPSLIQVVSGLWGTADYALAGIVALFSMIFPVVKLGVAFQTVLTRRPVFHWAGALSKWSMLDVLLVAILVFAAKTSGLATALAQPGVWFFAISTVATAIAMLGISRKR